MLNIQKYPHWLQLKSDFKITPLSNHITVNPIIENWKVDPVWALTMLPYMQKHRGPAWITFLECAEVHGTKSPKGKPTVRTGRF